MVGNLLSKVPERKVLFCISPSAAKDFGYLPVSLEDGILNVVGLKGYEPLKGLEKDSQEIFRKTINVVYYASVKDWNEAFRRFYDGLI